MFNREIYLLIPTSYSSQNKRNGIVKRRKLNRDANVIVREHLSKIEKQNDGKVIVILGPLKYVQ